MDVSVASNTAAIALQTVFDKAKLEMDAAEANKNSTAATFESVKGAQKKAVADAKNA